jgi:hypothetical protein
MSFPTGNSDRGILYGALTPAEQALARTAIKATPHYPTAITNPLVAAYESRQRSPKPLSGERRHPTSAHEARMCASTARDRMELVAACGGRHRFTTTRCGAISIRLRRRDRPLMKSRAAWMLSALCRAMRRGAGAQRAEFLQKLSFLAQSGAPKCG